MGGQLRGTSGRREDAAFGCAIPERAGQVQVGRQFYPVNDGEPSHTFARAMSSFSFRAQASGPLGLLSIGWGSTGLIMKRRRRRDSPLTFRGDYRARFLPFARDRQAVRAVAASRPDGGPS